MIYGLQKIMAIIGQQEKINLQQRIDEGLSRLCTLWLKIVKKW